MKPQHYTTLQVARAAGVHPNTVRQYEVWGFLPPVPRAPNGYRLYTEFHVDQMRFARTALHGGWPGRNIRESAVTLVRRSASGDLGGALEMAYRHLALVQAERAQAEGAANLLERWAQGTAIDATAKPLRIKDAARLLGVTSDMLRNWERNGLLKVPRDPHSRYRAYGAAELDRVRVIRTLSRAGYSNMAILRMLRRLDAGERYNLRQALDTPDPHEDVFTAADRWLSALQSFEQRAHEMIAQLEAMIRKKRRK
jgi:DNA-binding transcriptional MerR regulator